MVKEASGNRNHVMLRGLMIRKNEPGATMKPSYAIDRYESMEKGSKTPYHD